MAKTRLPAFVQEHVRLGRLDVGDLEMPRLKLLQASSPELTEFNNAKHGEFWHSLINESFGSTCSHLPNLHRLALYSVASAGGGRRHSCSSRRRQALDTRRHRVYG